MADIVSHATQGSLVLLAPFIRWVRRKSWLWIIGLTGAFFGALPDLIGAYGILVKHDHWALYGSAHRGAIAHVLQYVPMYWLHLAVDRRVHGLGQRWWVLSERLWMEIVLWVLNLLVIWWFVNIVRKNRQEPGQVRLPSYRDR